MDLHPLILCSYEDKPTMKRKLYEKIEFVEYFKHRIEMILRISDVKSIICLNHEVEGIVSNFGETFRLVL